MGYFQAFLLCVILAISLSNTVWACCENGDSCNCEPNCWERCFNNPPSTQEGKDAYIRIYNVSPSLFRLHYALKKSLFRWPSVWETSMPHASNPMERHICLTLRSQGQAPSNTKEIWLALLPKFNQLEITATHYAWTNFTTTSPTMSGAGNVKTGLFAP